MKNKALKLKGENYKIIKEYREFFLAIDEFGFNLKRIPKLRIIK